MKKLKYFPYFFLACYHVLTILYANRLNCPEAAMRSLQLAREHASSEPERLVYEGWILYDTGHCEEGLRKAEESVNLQRSFEAFFLKAYALADSCQDPSCSSTVISLLEEALKCPSDRLRKGQVWCLSSLFSLDLFNMFSHGCLKLEKLSLHIGCWHDRNFPLAYRILVTCPNIFWLMLGLFFPSSMWLLGVRFFIVFSP